VALRAENGFPVRFSLLLPRLTTRSNSRPQTPTRSKKTSILIVTGIEGARNCAAVVAEQIGVTVEVAEGRKTALAALRANRSSA
jgi:hypothetical protein